MISKIPRIVGRMVMGRQTMPTSVPSAVAEKINPQKRLMMPLTSVINAMAVNKPGFCSDCVFIRYSFFCEDITSEA